MLSLDQHYPCPLCGQSIPIKSSKRGKPYLVCDPCGVQLFIRKEPGILKLRELVEANKYDPVTHIPNIRVIQLLVILGELRAQLKKTEEKQGFINILFPDEDIELALKAIKAEIIKTQNQIKRAIKASPKTQATK